MQPSESISIGVEANPFRDIITDIDYGKAAGAGGISYTGKCTASQKSTLVTALSNALVYSDGAKNYLTNTTPSGTPRYSTWFGTYSSSNWNTVKSHYTNISSVYNTQPIVFDCSCKEDQYIRVRLSVAAVQDLSVRCVLECARDRHRFKGWNPGS